MVNGIDSLISLSDFSLLVYKNANDTTLRADSNEEIKTLLIKVKEESEKFGLKLNILHRKP